MHRSNMAIIITVLLLAGCGSATRNPVRGVYQGGGANEVTLTGLQAEVDSAAALYDFGDVKDFLAARDSLRSKLLAFADANPGIGEDEEFRGVIRNLDGLDSLDIFFASPGPTPLVDSLALANEDWPDIDSTEIAQAETAFSNTILFPEVHNDRIDFWIRYFTGPGKERFARVLYRMQLYRPIIKEILDELELPEELICVAMIESGFVLKARSRARAVGPWQFIAGTARIYGLRVNWWYDERRDIIASTYAAGNYLSDLYNIWDSWPLALAAYNCGEYRVARAVAYHKTTNFWELQLPRQTERYVPKFLAALYILRSPEKYGFTIPEVEPVTFDLVKVTDATDLKLIAQSAETTMDVIRDLNPSLLRWSTPPKMEIELKVPVGSGLVAQEKLDAIPPSERVTWRKHKIRTGETLSTISAQYGTSISALKELNGIRNAHRIRAGQYLIVPVQGPITEVASSKPRYKDTRRSINKEALESYARRYAPPAGYKKVTYRVKSGDTLGEIAEVYHTRASKIRTWNNLRYRSYIYPGQKLVIYVPDSFNVAGETISVKPPDPETHVKTAYVVRKGDTIYGISKKFNVAMSDLLAWNNRSTRSSRIYPGETLEVWQKRAQ